MQMREWNSDEGWEGPEGWLRFGYGVLMFELFLGLFNSWLIMCDNHNTFYK